MSFFSALESYFEGFLKGLFGQVKTTIITFLKSFAETDLGALATDAVQYVASALDKDTDSVAKRDAAVAKLKTDLVAAGKDIKSFSDSFLNFLIESAYQAVKGGVAVAEQNLPTAGS